MRTAVVTGANGFLGSALCNHLVLLGIRVFGIVKGQGSDISRLPTSSLLKVEYCDQLQLVSLRDRFIHEHVDTFFHFSWGGVSGDARFDSEIQTGNIRAACQAVELSRLIGCPIFIFASSLWEYECLKSMADIEDVKPTSVYSSAKIAAHFMTRTYCNMYGIQYMAAIITNIYGEGEISSRLISSTVIKLLKGEPTRFTSATQTYDFIHISDAVRAFVAIATRGKGNKSYYLGSTQPRPLSEFLLELGRAYGVETPLGIGLVSERGIHLDYGQFDLLELNRDTGFTNEVDFESGIRSYIAWMRKEYSS